MKRLSLMAVLAVAALTVALGAMTASASAAVLPEFTVNTKLTATFAKSKLNTSGAEIQSTKGGTTNSELVSKQAGKVHIVFEGSTLGGKECHSTGTGEKEGVITVPVEYHTVHGVGGSTYLILFLVTEEVKISCKFLATKVVVESGSTILGKIGPSKTKTTSFTLEVNAPEGKQEITEYENDSGVAVKTELKLKVDGVSAKGSQEDDAASITTESATELIN
jgi:hypothetical protein